MGEPKAITINQIKEIVESTGAKLISTSYINNHTPIEFLCSKCGNQWHITWKKYSCRQNQKFLCNECLKSWHKEYLREKKKGYSFDQIKSEFNKKGAELISKEYKNQFDDLYFKCSNCGKPWHIKMLVYKRGHNNDLLCRDCYLEKQGKVKIHFKELKKFFKENGSELYSKSFKSINQVIKYKCKNCGEVASYRYSTLMQRSGDRRFYCKDCVRGYRLNPNGNYGDTGHHIYDLKWFDYIYTFYNLNQDQKKVYSAHHIKQFSLFPEYRTSFCNGYPIKVKYHNLGSIDPITGLKNPFHVVNGYIKVSEYPDYVKLPYHNYSGFSFLDFNTKVITEIIAPIEDQDINYLKQKYDTYKQQGLLYIPFFFDELFVDRRLQISCSLLRRLLYQWFLDVYKYTGQEYKIISSDIVKVNVISKKVIKDFYKENSLSGFIDDNSYLGLYYNENLVMLLSYSYLNGVCKISGCIEKLNTVVIDGFSTLIQYLYSNYGIDCINYKQDLRFPIYNNELNNLNFKLNQITLPNEIYMHKDTNRFYKSLNKSVSWLNTKIDLGLSLESNSGNSEYIKVYDLGEAVYVWKKDKSNN